MYTVGMNNTTDVQQQSVTEMVEGDSYTYFPLGEHVVRAPDVCGGRPTFKYTRIEVSLILAFIAAGESISDIVDDYRHPHLTYDAIHEAVLLANNAFTSSTIATQPLAA